MNTFLILLVLNGFALVLLSVQPVAPTLYLIKQALSWPNARSYCKATYTDLVPVKTHQDLLDISDEAAHQNVTWPLWIGLYNQINSWRFSFLDLNLSAITFSKWGTGEPNNFRGIEQCGQINSLGLWSDYSCSINLSVICYNAQYPGNSSFVGITTHMNWTDAQTYCRRFHTDLASVLNTTDNSLLQQIAAAQGTSWIGLYRLGWTWTDQTKALNIYWAPGQPDNFYKDENCARFNGGLLEDMSCKARHYFFCYYIPVIRRKMLKLQVKSDQNVFDAAVQSALLTKILKKLEEHGLLEDVTVTWRVQPDGNIFYKKNDDL